MRSDWLNGYSAMFLMQVIHPMTLTFTSFSNKYSFKKMSTVEIFKSCMVFHYSVLISLNQSTICPVDIFQASIHLAIDHV